jgi:hypothetical protein
MTTGTRPVTDAPPPARTRALRAFSVLNGLVLLGVVLQGLWAGGFIGHLAGTFWLQLHRITAYTVVILALAAAILAVVTLRRHRAIAAWSAGLFTLVAIQAELGHEISHDGERSLIAVHVPVALLIMGLGVYLSIAAARAWRFDVGITNRTGR